MTLDQLIATTTLRGLTLWPCDKGWQANVTMDGIGWRVCIHRDPLEALRGALEALRGALRQCVDFMS